VNGVGLPPITPSSPAPSLAPQYLDRRPHRIRLLKEIERRKGLRDRVSVGRRERLCNTMASTRAFSEALATPTFQNERSPPESLATPEKSAHSALERNQKPPEACYSHPPNDKKAPSKQARNDQGNEAADSSSTSTACTPYEEVVSPAATLSPPVRDRARTLRTAGEDDTPPPTGRNDGEEGGPPATEVKASDPSENNERGKSAESGSGLASFVPKSNASAEGRDMAPGVRGTLQMSGVRAGDMKIALGDNKPFLQVKACDQLRRTNAVAGKGGQSRDRSPGDVARSVTLFA